MKSASEVFDLIRGLDEQSPGHIKSKHGPRRKTRKGSNVLSAHGPVVEDQEQIEEISKETLKSYIPKAIGSKEGADFMRGVKMGRETDRKGEDELRAKSLKRSVGIHTAIKRLTKESLDESRQVEIVREAMKSAKLKKKTKTNGEDKFEADPELSSQIIRND